MNTYKLTKSELNESIDFTIGKVRGAIKNISHGNNDIRTQRALALFNQVVKYLDEVKPIRI